VGVEGGQRRGGVLAQALHPRPAFGRTVVRHDANRLVPAARLGWQLDLQPGGAGFEEVGRPAPRRQGGRDGLVKSVARGGQLGLDPDRFLKDLNGEEVAKRIFQDGQRAHALGVNSTPTFFVNGKEAKDDQWKPEGLREMIKQALREAGK